MIGRLRSLLHGLFRRALVEDEMSREMEFHLSARAEDLARRGMTRREAFRQARLEFGGVERFKDEGRASRGLRLFDELGADLRYAWRQLLKKPSFTVLAVAILAIGIGANTAVFSTVDAIMLAALPVQDPGQLRHLEWIHKTGDFKKSYDGTWSESGGQRYFSSVSYPVYEYLRDHAQSYSDLALFKGGSGVLTAQGRGEMVQTQLVTGNFFRMLGTPALRGRTLTPEDDRRGAYLTAAISHRFWERRFGGDAGALGQTVTIGGKPVVIVGVLPKGWCGVDPGSCPDLYMPMQAVGDSALNDAERWYYEPVGRLKPGVAAEQARAETEALVAQAISTYRAAGSFVPPRVHLEDAGRGLDRLRSELTSSLKVLSWAVGAILLIACANIAGLLVARGRARQREIGTRLALGAGRGRLIRQLLAESLLLALLGTIAGVAAAYETGDAIARLLRDNDRTLGVAVSLNWHVLGAAVGLCLLTALLFGLLPALQATRLDTASALRGTGRAAERNRLMTAKGFLALQVGITLMLVLGSAAFLRTLLNLYSTPLGFRPDNLLTFRMDPTLNGYRGERLLSFYDAAIDRIGAIPGVRSVSMSRHGILSGGATSDGVNLPGGPNVGTRVHYIAPRFFETVGFPLLAGRDFDARDRDGAEHVVIVNQTLAQKLSEAESPLGRTVEIDGPRTVVGIAADTKYESLRKAAPPTLYIPYRQFSQHMMTMVVRSEIDPRALMAAVRREVAGVDATIPVQNMRTQAEVIDVQVRRERVFALLFSAFGAIALVLACLGIYGTLAYRVALRTPEIGVRLALGARRADVIAMTMRDAAAPVTVGVLAGFAGAAAAGKLIDKMMFGVKPNDPALLAAVAGILLLSAMVAGWLPARRASRIMPVEALRYD